MEYPCNVDSSYVIRTLFLVPKGICIRGHTEITVWTGTGPLVACCCLKCCLIVQYAGPAFVPLFYCLLYFSSGCFTDPLVRQWVAELEQMRKQNSSTHELPINTAS